MISYFVDPSGAILVKTHEAPDVEWGRPEIKTERLPAFQAMIARWTELVNEAGIEFRVPSREIFAIMWSESNGNPNAVSGAGAKGLMQVMPFHWPQGTQDSVMLDPRTNIRKGTEILAGRRAGGRHDLVQMASLYNAGGNTDGSPFTNDQRPKIATRWGYGAEPGYLDSVVAANNTAVRLGVIA
jgi:soluble lytic murein transglycosylase-like protein